MTGDDIDTYYLLVSAKANIVAAEQLLRAAAGDIAIAVGDASTVHKQSIATLREVLDLREKVFEEINGHRDTTEAAEE